MESSADSRKIWNIWSIPTAKQFLVRLENLIRDRILGAAKEFAIGRLRSFIENDTHVRYEIIGRENIDSIRELLAREKIVIAVLDHRSYADMATGMFVVVREKFEDLIRPAHPIMKISHVQRFPGSLLRNYFEGIIPVVPHTMSESDYPNRNEINRQAIKTAQNLPGGSLLVITPEGTRSGRVAMQEARHGAEKFWHGLEGEAGERYIIPIAIEGTENQWRKGSLSGLNYAIWGHYRNSKFIFGGPVAVSEIDSMASQLAQTPEELAKLKTDVVMAQIARLHIEYGNPRYAGVYTDLARQIQELKSAA